MGDVGELRGVMGCGGVGVVGVAECWSRGLWGCWGLRCCDWVRWNIELGLLGSESWV